MHHIISSHSSSLFANTRLFKYLFCVVGGQDWKVKCFTLPYPTSFYQNSIFQAYDKPAIKRLRTQYISSPVAPKVKETHFKIFNSIYPSSEFLRCRFNFEENVCSFCQVDRDNWSSFLFCMYSRIFWENVSYWLETKIQSLPNLVRKHIIFGMLLDDKNNDFFINTMLILGKFFFTNANVWIQNLIFLFLRETLFTFISAIVYAHVYFVQHVQ